MLKNKKVMLLMFILFIGALIFIAPTEVKAADEYIVTRTTTIENWYNDPFDYYLGADYSKPDDSHYTYSVELTGKVNGVDKTIQFDTTNSGLTQLSDKSKYNFDVGETVTVTEKFDFTNWINSLEVGSHEEEFGVEHVGIEFIPNYINGTYSNQQIGAEIDSYITSEYTQAQSFRIVATVVNNTDQNGTPTNTYTRTLSAYWDYNGKSLNYSCGKIKLPIFYMNITGKVTGNAADTSGTLSISDNESHEDLDNIVANSTTIIGSKTVPMVGFDRMSHILNSLNGYNGTAESDHTVYYSLDTDSSYTYSSNVASGTTIDSLLTPLKTTVDEQEVLTGAWHIDFTVEAHKETTVPTGKSYNILPYAGTILLAIAGAFILKKTSSKE